MQLDNFCLTQTCHNVHELSFKGKDEGLPQMAAEWTPPGCTVQVIFGGCGFRFNADYQQTA